MLSLGCILHLFLFIQDFIICKLSIKNFQFLFEDLAIRTCLMPVSLNLVFHLFMFGNPSIKFTGAHAVIKSALCIYWVFGVNLINLSVRNIAKPRPEIRINWGLGTILNWDFHHLGTVQCLWRLTAAQRVESIPCKSLGWYACLRKPALRLTGLIKEFILYYSSYLFKVSAKLCHSVVLLLFMW